MKNQEDLLELRSVRVRKKKTIRQVSWLSRRRRLPTPLQEIVAWIDGPLARSLIEVEVKGQGHGITVAGPLRIRTGIPWLLNWSYKSYFVNGGGVKRKVDRLN
jgi:hypothetical protein